MSKLAYAVDHEILIPPRIETVLLWLALLQMQLLLLLLLLPVLMMIAAAAVASRGRLVRDSAERILKNRRGYYK